MSFSLLSRSRPKRYFTMCCQLLILLVLALTIPRTTAGAIALSSDTIYFDPPATIRLTTQPFMDALLDLNDDGSLDLVTVNYNQDNVSVLLNTTPQGTTPLSFSPEYNFSIGYRPTALAMGDLDSDGRSDLAVAESGNDSVGILLNKTASADTAPSFGPRQILQTGAGPHSVQIADINTDGRPDLIVTSTSDNSVDVLLNTSVPGTTTLSFAAYQAFATGLQPVALVVDDLNTDGYPDLAIQNAGDNSISILVNATAPGAATPMFAAHQNLMAGAAVESLAVSDFNADGRQDVAFVSSSDSVSVMINTTAVGDTMVSFAPRETFRTGNGTISLRVGDFNIDGKPDLTAAHVVDVTTASVLINTAPTSATLPSFAVQKVGSRDLTTLGQPRALAIGDINHNGSLDLAVAYADASKIEVLLNRPYIIYTPMITKQ